MTKPLKEMYKEYITLINLYLKPFGTISCRTMFGAYRVFLNGEMIFGINNNGLSLKQTDLTEEEFSKLGLKKIMYQKKQFQVNSGFSLITPELLNDSVKFERLVNLTIESALKSRQSKLNRHDDITEIRDLTNINRHLAQRLNQIGINSPQKLKNKGAVNAYIELKNKSPKKATSVATMFRLDGAIHNIHYKAILEPRLEHLLNELEQKEKRLNSNN